MKRLIVTADDFGAASAVNEAVEQAHRHGILTAASLMVAGEAAADAVARARTMPTLGVGLHLVLVEGRPMLPPGRIPDLVTRDGRLRTDMARFGVAIQFRPSVRAQLRAEINAQFAAFAATGLPLDHVNAHKHFHLHPVIAGMMIEAGARHGLRAARAPIEPIAALRQIEPVRASMSGRVAAPWARAVGRRMRRAGLFVPDRVFGLAWSGGMTRDRMRALVARLPEGATEIYTHPATDDLYSGHAPGYLYRAELAALLDPALHEMLADHDATLGRFADFARAPAA